MTRWIDAAFVRGGTSKGLFFRADLLPSPGPERDRIFTAALGSPDPFGRQLDGMGGGISSLSKVMAVAVSGRQDADLDYTFGQVAVDAAQVDYTANCGNLSAGVAAFGLLEGMVVLPDGPATVRLFNTNTGKRVLVNLEVTGGQAAVSGELAIPGVAGTGAPVELIYPDPAGSRTGALLPTGNPVDLLDADGDRIEASLIDAALPMVLVRAGDLGLTGVEAPEALDAHGAVMARLEALRRAGAVAMGMAAGLHEVPSAAPKVALLAPSSDATLLDGSSLPAGRADLSVRMISIGQAHKAIPGTGAMCLAAAALVPGSLVERMLPAQPRTGQDAPLRIATPSGVVVAAARAGRTPGQVARTSLYRTARVLMRGAVAIPGPR